MTDRQKNSIKWLLVLLILALLVYVFRDLAVPIVKQLARTSPWMIAGILAASLLYGVFESVVTMLFARQYHKEFSFRQAWGMTWFVSFYRTATMGSGAGVSALVYLSKNGLQTSEAFGMYMLEYAVHKFTIGGMAVVLYLMHFSYMKEWFGGYNAYIGLGFAVTVAITACLVLFACAGWFHRLVKRVLDLVNRSGRFDERFDRIKEQCDVMEETSRRILRNRKLLAAVAGIDMIKVSCWYMIPYIVLYQTGCVTPVVSLAITTVAVMLAAVIPAPAGIGSSEFVMIAMFGAVAGQTAAGAMSLLYRFATFVFPCALGAVYAAKFAARKEEMK